jgi:TetR/AcrR family transcriptional repressor of nem operon
MVVVTELDYITIIIYHVKHHPDGGSNMRVSREQAAKNREHVVDTAARLFRERGYDGIGVLDLMKEAGLTHGGFYGNFASKEQLMAEACARAFDGSRQIWEKLMARDGAAALQSIADAYLSRRHVEQPGIGCAVAALGPDAARLAPPVRAAMTAGIKAQIESLAQLCEDEDEAARRAQAISTYAAMVGALVLARVVDDATLSDEILATVRERI